MSDYIDLHTHSLYSDGYKTVSELVELAKSNNVRIFAIADHDDVRSFDILKPLAHRNGIKIISAIELSAYYINPADKKAKKVHLLGYGIDVHNTKLLNQLADLKNKRYKENITMLNNLLENGIDVPNCIFDEVRFDNYLSIVTEMKRVLIKNNYDYEYVKNFMGKAKVYAPNYKNYEIEISDALKLITQSGGVAVLPHPHEIQMGFADKNTMVQQLKNLGLKGIEVYCSEASEFETLENMQLATQNNLLVSVGSDYHRPDKNNKTIGRGINNNLCKSKSSFTDYLVEENLLIQ